MIRIKRTRRVFTAANRRLNRARRLYFWFARRDIMDWPTLEMVADSMIDHGLYHVGRSTHDVAFSIARFLYRYYFERVSSWNIEHWWAFMERFEWCGQADRHLDERTKAAAEKYPMPILPWHQSPQ